MYTQTRQTNVRVNQGVPLECIGDMSNAMAIRHAAAYAAFKNEDDIVHAARTAMSTHCETTAQTDDPALTSMARLWDVGKTEPIKVGKASQTEKLLRSLPLLKDSANANAGL